MCVGVAESGHRRGPHLSHGGARERGGLHRALLRPGGTDHPHEEAGLRLLAGQVPQRAGRGRVGLHHRGLLRLQRPHLHL